MRKRSQNVKEKHKEYHYEVPFVFNGFFEEKELFDELLKTIFVLFEGKEIDSFKVAVSWPIDLKDEAARFHLKHSLQGELNKVIEVKGKKRIEFYDPHAVLLINFNKRKILLRLSPVFVYGRYSKFSRKIAQTEYFCNKCYGRGCWYCKDTGHFSEESVEQLVGNFFKEEFRAKDIILHGAGREDLDVLMLGKGRPFIMEIISPEKRFADLSALEKKVNLGLEGDVSVNSLKFSSKSEVAPLKDNPHEKIYKALVQTQNPIDSHKLGQLVLDKEMAVLQKTPSRVEKRRAVLERKKNVTLLEAELIDSSHFNLTLRTSHGTYVKEFISGDGEKTTPSVSSLLSVPCACVQLDVLEIID